MPYELTQIRAHMQRFMKEIGDVLTTEEDLARYEDFNNKIRTLAATTNLHYDNKQPFLRSMGKDLRKAYQDALEAALFLVSSREEAGTVGMRLRTVAREMIPLMQADVQMLDQISMKADQENYTLPELIAQIRDFSDKSAACRIYKTESLKTHNAGESTARRQEAATNSNEMMFSRYNSYKAARKERLKPIHLVHEKIREVQGTLGALGGEALREKAVQILYLNGLTRMELDKKSGMGIRRAMTGQKLAEPNCMYNE